MARFANRGDPRRGWQLSGSVTENPIQLPIGGGGNLVKVSREDQWAIRPGLAETWEPNSNFTQWTFKLRDGLTWHDGVPLNAESFKQMMDLIVFGYKDRPRDSEAFQWGYPWVERVEALPGNQVRIHLNVPVPTYALLLARETNTMLYPPHLMLPKIDAGNKGVTPLDVNVVGAGPFRFKEYVRGSFASVRRFDRYWEKDHKGRQLPYLDGIDFAIITDRDTMLAALRTGRIDNSARGSGFELLPGQDEILRRDLGDGVQFLVGDVVGGDGFVLFNAIAGGPWQDVRVRKAASLAWDRREFRDYATGGKGDLRAIFPAGSPYVNPDYLTWPGWNADTREKDIAEAKRLLADAGYPNGFKTVFLARAGAWAEVAEFHVRQLARLGIQAEIDIRDQTTFNSMICTTGFQLANATSPTSILRVPGAGAADYLSFDREHCAGGAKHNDPKVDQYVERMASTAPGPQLITLAREFERYMLAEQAYIITATNYKVYAYRTYLKGMLPSISETQNGLDSAWVWLDK